MAKSAKPRSARAQPPKASETQAQDAVPDFEMPLPETPDDSAIQLPEPNDEASQTAATMGDHPAQTTETTADGPMNGTLAADGPPMESANADAVDNAPPEAPEPPVQDEPAPQTDAVETPTAAKDAAPESALTLPPATVHRPRIASGPGFLTLLLGGVIAGGIGYAIAEYDVFGRGAPDPLAALEIRLADQTARIDALGEQTSAAAQAAADAAQPADISALRDEIANLPATGGAPDTGLTERVDTVEQQLADLSTQLANRPADTGASSEALSAYESQLAALQTELDNQRAAIADATSAAADARSAAADETRRITVQAALAQLSAALENGTPFVGATSALETAGGLTVPEGLAASASSGVVTLAALQDAFPGVARTALGVSIRETSDGGVLDRFGAFLRTQTGARSLDARAGDDPDAVLSRAEAAVKSGELSVALDELVALPEAGQAVMANWSQQAQARLAATSALNDLVTATNSN